MNPQAIEVEAVTVKFGDFFALSHVTASFEPGKIHALVGQNGAGKTTLARVMAGLVTPTEGRTLTEGRELPPGDVGASRSSGIEMVHQSFALPPSMTVAEALEFGSASKQNRFFSRRKLNARWQEYLDRMGIEVEASAKLSKLPVETLQSIEIARALSGRAKVLILDEPTAVLPPSAVSRLFDQIRSLKARGVTVIVVLHKVREVLEIADTVTVLRHGSLVMGSADAGSIDSAELSKVIIGQVEHRSAPHFDRVESGQSGAPAGPLFQLEGASSVSNGGGPGLEAVDLALFPGEIVGVAGVEGNGQVALVDAITGLRGLTAGSAHLAGSEVSGKGVLARRQLGVRAIPFDRNTQGLSGASPLWQNWSIPLLAAKRGLVNPARLRTEAEASLRSWDVRFSSINQTAGSLSGGNAQKVILARELDALARIVIAAQPTRGLDLGAVEFVWDALRAVRNSGGTVLLVSSDLDELLAISDRVVVLYGGRAVLTTARPFSLDEIGAAMTGAAA